jgi:hypothetical protein
MLPNSVKILVRLEESYDEVLQRLFALRTDEGELSEEAIRDIEMGLEDVKSGRTLNGRSQKTADK